MQAASSWLYIYPPGFRDLLLFIKKYYGNPTIYITENGTDLDTIDPIYTLLLFKDLATSLIRNCSKTLNKFFSHVYFRKATARSTPNPKNRTETT